MIAKQFEQKLRTEYDSLSFLPVPTIMYEFQLGFTTFVLNAGCIPEEDKFAIQTRDENGIEFIYRIPPDDDKLKAWVKYCIYNPGRNIIPSLVEFGRRHNGNSYADIKGKSHTYPHVKNFKGDNG